MYDKKEEEEDLPPGGGVFFPFRCRKARQSPGPTQPGGRKFSSRGTIQNSTYIRGVSFFLWVPQHNLCNLSHFICGKKSDFIKTCYFSSSFYFIFYGCFFGARFVMGKRKRRKKNKRKEYCTVLYVHTLERFLTIFFFKIICKIYVSYNTLHVP